MNMNHDIKVIVWFVGWLVTMYSMYECLAPTNLVRMFPEGDRWWRLPVAFISIALYSAVLLNHPF
jgi:hypothetical protein